MKRFVASLLPAALALSAVPAAAQVDAHIPDVLRDITPIKPQVLRIPISEEAAEWQRNNMMFAPGGDPLPIFLNRDGGTYYGTDVGADDSSQNFSSIVYGGSATVGDFPGTDDDWNTLTTCVGDVFARFNVVVTDEEPLEGDYVEAVVGGNPNELGMSGGVGGVAPYDPSTCGMMSKAVVYAFAESYMFFDRDGSDQAFEAYELQSLCETVAQEVAHAFTLDHEMLCSDPMTYLDDCGAKQFQDVYAPCGEYEERECTCGPGGDVQNSTRMLFDLLGPAEGVTVPPPLDDQAPPVLAFVSPDNGATVLRDSTLEIVATVTDDNDLATVKLEWLDSGASIPCPGEGANWSCAVNGDTYAWSVEVGAGLRELRISARDIAGKKAETETRWVWLGESLDEERPLDETPPEVTMVWPVPDQLVTSSEDTAITATVYDAETGVSQVGLVIYGWGGSFIVPCVEDAEETFVRCERVGGTYTFYRRNRRDGARDWAIYAKDYLGNETITDPRTYHVTSDVVEPPINDSHENNDTWDLAEDLACGTALDLKAAPYDADWFTVHAPVGMVVEATVTGDIADRLRLSAHTSPTFAGIKEHLPAKAGFAVPVGEEGLRVRVMSDGTVSGDYRLQVTCSYPMPEVDENVTPPGLLGGTCSHTTTGEGPGALFAALALLGVALRRRRRG